MWKALMSVAPFGTWAVSEAEVASHWAAFKETHQRVYATDAEESIRVGIFRDNLDFIAAENAKNHSYTLGITAFTDISRDEFQQRLQAGSPRAALGDAPTLGEHEWDGSDLPASVDWQAQGATTPVMDENQHNCYGACWAFSATGAIEGAHHISSGRLVSLSKQQLMDCSSQYGNQGCDGGVMDYAFRYAQQSAMCTEESYPYYGPVGSCRAQQCEQALPAGTVLGYREVQHSEQSLQSAVAQQPVSIAVQGAWGHGSAFQFYTGGILSSECGQNADHGVLLVGYGTSSDGRAYWKVKNTYGAQWGEQGYARLERNAPGMAGTGTCGLLTMPSYPVVSSQDVVV